MIDSLVIKNFGPIVDLSIESLGHINLFIGENGCGKSYILKSIYSAIKSIEQHNRGKENRTVNELLADKLYWTFQADELGKLVNKRSETLIFTIKTKEEQLKFSFGKSTTKSIKDVESTFLPTNTNSIFLPTKEILSSRNIIIDKKDNDKEFGFDDTYYDLAKALTPVTKGKNYKQFSESRETLMRLINGRIYFDDSTKEWKFKDNNNFIYPIGVTSEGVKKISILETLLGNKYLSKGSIIFIDEPESNLHPKLISEFMEIIYELSKTGIQFFIATHSYFVIKKLYIIAQKNKISIPIVSFDQNITKGDLKEDMPTNPIIEESINLYKEEIEL